MTETAERGESQVPTPEELEGEELAEDEGAATPPDEPAPGDTPPDEQPPESFTPEQAEATFKSLEREADRHAREVEKRAGPMFADLVPCPACITPGFMLNPAIAPVDDERKAAVLAVLGETGLPNYREAGHVRPCDDCAAWGVVLTGSHVPGQETVPCPTCTGKGHVPNLDAPAQPAAPPLGVPPVSPPVLTGANGGQVTDPWGRPLGHPHYGRAPAEVT